jgi:hypothetical protein
MGLKAMFNQPPKAMPHNSLEENRKRVRVTLTL